MAAGWLQSVDCETDLQPRRNCFSPRSGRLVVSADARTCQVLWSGTGKSVEFGGHEAAVVDMTSAYLPHARLLRAQTYPAQVARHRRQERKEIAHRRDETREYWESSSPDRDNVCRMEHTAPREYGNRQGSGSRPTKPAAIIPPNSVRTPTAYQQTAATREQRGRGQAATLGRETRRLAPCVDGDERVGSVGRMRGSRAAERSQGETEDGRTMDPAASDGGGPGDGASL